MNKSFFSKKSKGFTLMELVIVLVIIGILATISVPLYTSYVRRSYAAEGNALCDSIAAAEKVYYTANGAYFAIAVAAAGAKNYIGTADAGDIAVDTTSNIYFPTFAVTVTAPALPYGVCTYTIVTKGLVGSKAEGITITYAAGSQKVPTVTVAGI